MFFRIGAEIALICKKINIISLKNELKFHLTFILLISTKTKQIKT
jgi:hypothetical protein